MKTCSLRIIVFHMIKFSARRRTQRRIERQLAGVELTETSSNSLLLSPGGAPVGPDVGVAVGLEVGAPVGPGVGLGVGRPVGAPVAGAGVAAEVFVCHMPSQSPSQLNWDSLQNSTVVQTDASISGFIQQVSVLGVWGA